MKENIAWNYPKWLINFIPPFILTQAIVVGVLIFLYADSFFDLNEEDGIIIPDGIFVEYFNITLYYFIRNYSTYFFPISIKENKYACKICL